MKCENCNKDLIIDYKIIINGNTISGVLNCENPICQELVKEKAPSFIRKGVCMKCSSEFDVKAPWQMFCSNNCRVKNHRTKNVISKNEENLTFEDMKISVKIDDEFIFIEDVKYIDYTPSIIEICIELQEAHNIMSKIGECFFNLNISFGKFSEVIECCKVIDWKYRHEKSMHKLYATLLISQE